MLKSYPLEYIRAEMVHGYASLHEKKQLDCSEVDMQLALSLQHFNQSSRALHRETTT